MEPEKQKSEQLVSLPNQSIYNDISYYGYPAQSEDTPANSEENVNEKTNDVDSNNAEKNTGIWQEFSSSTSIHGLRLTGDPTVQKWRRILWVFLVLASAAIFFERGYGTLSRLINPGFKTEITAEMSGNLDFPAVTICNLNQYRQSFLRASPEFRLVLATLFGEDTINSFKSFYEDIDFNNLNDMNITDVNVTKLFREAAHKMEEMVVGYGYSGGYTWNDFSGKKFDEFQPRFTELGLCYTYNWDEENSKKVTSPGTKYGLQITFNIQQYEYFISEAVGISAGLRVLIHDQKETPLVAQFGIGVAPNTEALVAVSKTKTTRLNGCYKTGDEDFKNPLKFHKHYTRNACLSECQVSYINVSCGCKAYYDAGDYDICLNYTSIMCRYYHQGLFASNFTSDCDCFPQCEENKYIVKPSYNMYPARGYEQFYLRGLKKFKMFENITVDFVRENYIELVVYLDDTMVTNAVQKVDYTFIDFGGDLGGYMGLFLGVSVLSVIELLEFMIVFCIKCATKYSPTRIGL